MLSEATFLSPSVKFQAPLRIVIIENDPVMQLGLEQFLERYDSFQVVGAARDRDSAIALTLTLKPDIVVMDMGLPRLDGITTIQQIKQKQPSVRVVMLTAHTADYDMVAALASGADAYCIKGSSLEQLEIAINCAFRGATYLDPQIARRVIGHLQCDKKLENQRQRYEKQENQKQTLDINLSKREQQVLELIVEGKSNPEIAAELFLSISTVKTHLRSIMSKLSVDDRVQAAVAALRGGLI